MQANVFKNSSNTVRGSRGFTMIELLVVLAIILVLGILAQPYARGIIINGKVDPTAGDISKIVAKLRSNFSGQGTTPYTNMGAATAATAVFANTGRGLVSALSISGEGATATIAHDIGSTGSQLTVSQATITTLGDSFSVSVPTVSDAACPGLAASLSKSAEAITVNGALAKGANGVYNGGIAQNACVAGENNTFVFTFR